jgi:hypothetical protein
VLAELKSIQGDSNPPAGAVLERFAAEIKEIFESDIELTPREKRKALELLDTRVLIDGERNVRIEGMFGRAPNGLIARTS